MTDSICDIAQEFYSEARAVVEGLKRYDSDGVQEPEGFKDVYFTTRTFGGFGKGGVAIGFEGGELESECLSGTKMVLVRNHPEDLQGRIIAELMKLGATLGTPLTDALKLEKEKHV